MRAALDGDRGVPASHEQSRKDALQHERGAARRSHSELEVPGAHLTRHSSIIIPEMLTGHLGPNVTLRDRHTAANHLSLVAPG